MVYGYGKLLQIFHIIAMLLGIFMEKSPVYRLQEGIGQGLVERMRRCAKELGHAINTGIKNN